MLISKKLNFQNNRPQKRTARVGLAERIVGFGGRQGVNNPFNRLIWTILTPANAMSGTYLVRMLFLIWSHNAEDGGGLADTMPDRSRLLQHIFRKLVPLRHQVVDLDFLADAHACHFFSIR